MVLRSVCRRALLVGLLGVASAKAQEWPKVGEAAPAVTYAQVLQAPQGVDTRWEALRGKAVVVEFWATWCGGCVENIPHMNQLEDQFAGKPIQFISITDEEKGDVLRFLAKHPIHGWVALDPKRDSFKTYKAEGIPQTVLIDAKGTLRAITGPSDVNEKVLGDLLAGRDVKVRSVLDAGTPAILGAEPGAPKPLVQVMIRPAAPVDVSRVSPGFASSRDGRYAAYGVTVRDLLADAYDIPASRVDAPEWCSTVRYDVSVVVPRGGEADQWPLLQQTFAQAFHFRVRREARKTNAYVLRTEPGLEVKMKTSAATASKSRPWGGQGEFDAVGAQMKSVVWVAGIVLQAEVFDETGLQGRYDFDLKWNHKDPSSLVSAIREQLGLALVPVERQMEHLVVETGEEPRTW